MLQKAPYSIVLKVYRLQVALALMLTYRLPFLRYSRQENLSLVVVTNSDYSSFKTTPPRFLIES